MAMGISVGDKYLLRSWKDGDCWLVRRLDDVKKYHSISKDRRID